MDSSRSLFSYIAYLIRENSSLSSRLPGRNTIQECIFLKPGMFSRYFGSCVKNVKVSASQQGKLSA